MEHLITYGPPIITAFLLMCLIMPLLRWAAIQVSLVDKPDWRKVHAGAVPLIGGVALVTTIVITLWLYLGKEAFSGQLFHLLTGAVVFLLVGVLDDRYNVKPVFRLIIQFELAWLVFSSGIQIGSLHGIFGFYNIPLEFQMALTLVVIVGVINAFNLTDGIDGLAGGLAIIGFLAYAILAWLLGKPQLLLFNLCLVSALAGFLRFNLSKKFKIFLGDAGSLVLGYLLVVMGLLLIQEAASTAFNSLALVTVVAVLFIPVFDSLRVYINRIRSGKSPFRPDKSHLHHLALILAGRHKKSTLIILAFNLALFALMLAAVKITSIVTGFILAFVFFLVVVSIFELNNKLVIWTARIKKMEGL